MAASDHSLKLNFKTNHWIYLMRIMAFWHLWGWQHWQFRGRLSHSMCYIKNCKVCYYWQWISTGVLWGHLQNILTSWHEMDNGTHDSSVRGKAVAHLFFLFDSVCVCNGWIFRVFFKKLFSVDAHQIMSNKSFLPMSDPSRCYIAGISFGTHPRWLAVSAIAE